MWKGGEKKKEARWNQRMKTDRHSHVEDEEFDKIGRDVIEDWVLHVDFGYQLTLGKAHHVMRGNDFVECILHKTTKK